MSLLTWRAYFMNGDWVIIRSMTIEGDSLVLITSYGNVTSYMEMLITPKRSEIVENNFRTGNFPSVQYANYQIRALRKNEFNISSNFILFSTTEILYTNKDMSPIKTICRLNLAYQILEALFT